MTTPRRVPRHQRLDAAPVLVGTYSPGTSVIHRLPAGAKIFVVIGFSLVVGCVRTVPIAIGALVVAIILWASAALSWRTLMGLWPLVFVVGPMAGYHVARQPNVGVHDACWFDRCCHGGNCRVTHHQHNRHH